MCVEKWWKVYHLDFWWFLPVPVWPIPSYRGLWSSLHSLPTQAIRTWSKTSICCTRWTQRHLTHLDTSWHNSELCDAMLAAGYALLIFACSFSMLFSCFSHFLTWFACCLFRLEVKYLYALQQWCCLQAPKQSRSPRCRSVKRRETFWFGFWMVLSTDRIPTCRADEHDELVHDCIARFGSHCESWMSPLHPLLMSRSSYNHFSIKVWSPWLKCPYFST